MNNKIAIIGAGLSGVILAKELAQHAEVEVFEKARGIGGRMATRYADPYQFDHGAQFFLAKSDEFVSFCQKLEAEGVLAKWYPQFAEMEADKITQTRKWDDKVPHYVAVPKMNQLCKHIAQGLDVKIATRAEKIEKEDEKWKITSDKGEVLGVYDWVISAAPAEQTAELMPDVFAHKDRVKNAKMQGCYSLMLGYEKPLDLPWQVALVKHTDLSWISVNSSKPKRETDFSLVALATNNWAEEHMEDDQEAVKEHMLDELEKVTGQNVRSAPHQVLHRWRYANIGTQTGEAALYDEVNKLGACGDWCVHGRVESTFISAKYLANKILENIK